MPSSFRRLVPWSMFLGALLLLACVVLDLGIQAFQLFAAPAMAQAEDAAAIPTKVAFYIPPSPTPAETQRPEPTATFQMRATATRTFTPIPKPSLTVLASRTAPPIARPALNLALATATAAQTIAMPTVSTVGLTVGESYSLLQVLSPPTDRPAARQADLNPSLRGAVSVSATLTLVDYTGDTDPGAPQLAGLVSDGRTPSLTGAFQVYDWNWDCDCRGQLLAEPEVTLVGMRMSPGEILRIPSAGATIGNGYQVLVLYADADRIAFVYTRSDNVVKGYALHVEGVGVDATLLALYRQANDAGRGELPALRAGQGFGRAKSGEIRVAIRDTGTFMDPRSRKDWWRGR